MLRGLTTISFWADDLAVAKQWYTTVLGCEPYFARPNPDGTLAYIEFRLGDYQHELGIVDRRYAPPGAVVDPSGAIVYWHVDELAATYERLLALGATPYQPPTERGPGFVTAAVVDPFGNVLGIMYNVHYLAVLAARQAVADPVLEIVHFRVKAGVSDEQVLAASAQAQEWVSQRPGYLARELSKNAEGQWIDIVHWRSLAEAQAAAQQIMQEPCAANLMALLDPAQITIDHLESKQAFSAAQ